jgi:hypothetical protein
MTSFVRNTIRNADSNNTIKNILIAPYDGIFEKLLQKYTPHHYYHLTGTTYFNIIQPDFNPISINSQDWEPFFDVDLVICNHMESQFNICQQLSQALHVPLIIIHHGLPSPVVKKQDMIILYHQSKCNTRISTYPIVNKSWYADFEIIPPGIESTPIVNGNKISIIGKFDNNIISFIQQIRQHYPKPIEVYGENPGFSQPVSYEQALKIIDESEIYINLYNNLDVSYLMLYALSKGKKVISSLSKISQEIIQNNVNGYLTNSLQDIITALQIPFSETMKNNAIDSVKQYSIENFTQNWNHFLQQTFRTVQ